MKSTILPAGLALVLLLGTAACGSGDPLSDSSGPTKAGTIIVGSANFPESEVLMYLYADALKAKGVNVSTRPGIGSRETYIPALKDGSVTLMPEYTGALAKYLDPTMTATDAEGVLAAVTKALPQGLTVLTPAQAQDSDSLVVTAQTAQEHDLRSIADLHPVAHTLVIGGPPEWKTRSTGLPGLKSVYGLTFQEFKPLDVAGPLTVQALKNGQVQVANLFSTDPSIAANNFVVLADTKHLFPAQNVVPLIATNAASEPVRHALDHVSRKLDTPALAALVRQVVIDKKDPATVAQQFLDTHPVG